MPIYEYRCGACNRKCSFFTRSIGARLEAVCPECGSHDMRRVISTVSFKTSRGSSSEVDYYQDPSNIGRHVEDSFARHGMDMPEPIRQKIDDARRGKMPEELDI